MSTDNAATTLEKLQQELSALRQQNEEYRHLASFPELSPISIFEFDRTGQPVCLNHAAQQMLNQLSLIDARVFLPEGLAELINGDEDNVLQSYKELKIKDQVFEETIAHSKEYDTVRVYANNITQRRQAEEALKAKTVELNRTLEFLEAATNYPTCSSRSSPPRNMVWGWSYPSAMVLSRNMADRSRSKVSLVRERISPFGYPDWYNSIM